LLLEWNQKINLVSRQDTERIVPYHFIDSLLVVNEIPKNSAVGDLGSGAGLPGIPLKIVRDDIKLYLIESIQKKAAFLDLVAERLSLANVTVLPERAENITDIKCDLVLIRLIGRIKKVVPIVIHFLNPAGKIIFYKSETVAEEITEANKVIAKFKLRPTIKEIKLPGTKIIRRLVILERLN
jgi:16S rRNA (guanine527-N7)-methyltransferase